MIVRDAEATIARCVNSVLPYVDRAVFIDTGCTDNTIEVIRDTVGSIPVTYYASEWVGHYVNRTELLQKVRLSGADFCLMPDADMELVVDDGAWPEVLDADEYMIEIHDRGLIYPLPLMTSTGKNFYYAGVAHCYLACEDGPTNGVKMTGVRLIDHGGGGHRPGKIERDAELLAAEVGKNPNDRRSWFYLAQSYRDLDQVEKAIAAYKIRATLGGWQEEVYQSLYQAGMLLCEHINYFEGAKLLIAAADLKHNRAEALRALAGCSASVADKIPFPNEEVLFVEPGAYRIHNAPPEPVQFESNRNGVTLMPPLPDVRSKVKRRRRAAITAKDITAILVTRGDVPMEPILDTLPYDEVLIWDNSKADHDYKIFGRYVAIPEARHAVVYWQDDDVIFTNHKELMASYQPGVALGNMDEPWIKGAGYENTCLFGAGSLCDAHLPNEIFSKYFERYPFDDDILVEADFAFGTLVNWFRVDLGYGVREFADNADRLYLQQGQTERKWRMINRCLEMQKL
jgi:glycosyltransferase involved in cell wall biosynthesis